jgi:hypothetical protein
VSICDCTLSAIGNQSVGAVIKFAFITAVPKTNQCAIWRTYTMESAKNSTWNLRRRRQSTAIDQSIDYFLASTGEANRQAMKIMIIIRSRASAGVPERTRVVFRRFHFFTRHVRGSNALRASLSDMWPRPPPFETKVDDPRWLLPTGQRRCSSAGRCAATPHRRSSDPAASCSESSARQHSVASPSVGTCEARRSVELGGRGVRALITQQEGKLFEARQRC